MRRSALVASVCLASFTLLGVACEVRKDHSIGVAPRTLSVGDVNGDGALDLVVASVSEPSAESGGLEPEQILVKLGDGHGQFGGVLRSAGITTPEHTSLADFNGDGRLDVVAVNRYAQVQAFFGDGAGKFTPGPSVTACEEASDLVVAPLNADSTLDLAVVCREEGATYLRLVFGAAGGQLTLGPTFDVLPNRFLAQSADAGDLDSDGDEDLVVVGSYDGQPGAVTQLNDGTGNFDVLPVVPAGGTRVKLIDVTGDGKLDAVTTGANLSILPGNGDGTFGAAKVTPATEALGDLAVADLDGDCLADVAATGVSGVHLFLARSDGTYAERLSSSGANPVDIAAGDFDGNGRQDVVDLNRTSPGSVTLFTDITK